MSEQPEGSHVRWPAGFEEGAYDWDDVGDFIHNMRGDRRGASSSWSMRCPNDKYVADEAVTIQQMQEAGAL